MNKKVLAILLLIISISTIYALYRLDRRCGYITDEKWKIKSDTVIIIDDDGDPKGMRRMIKLCNELNIKCLFAVIGDRKEYYDFYDSCRAEGFRIVSHSYSHSKKLDPYEDAYDTNVLRRDILTAKKSLSKITTDDSIFVAPRNCGKDYSSREILGEEHKICFVGSFLPTDYFIYPRTHCIPRYFLGKNTPMPDFIKHIKICRKYKKPIVLALHSYNDNEWDYDYMKDCIKFALTSKVSADGATALILSR